MVISIPLILTVRFPFPVIIHPILVLILLFLLL